MTKVKKHGQRTLAGQMTFGSMMPVSDWRPPTIEQLPSSWRDIKRLAVDIEAKDEDLRTHGPGVRRLSNYPCGVAFAVEDGPEFYLPTRHYEGGNCEFDVWAYLRDRFKEFDGALVGAGMGYDLDWLEEMGCDVLGKRCMDVQVADPLINELHRQYNLEVICHRLGLPGKDEKLLREAASMLGLDPKKHLWRLHSKYVGQYGQMDVRRPLQVLRRQERLMVEEDVSAIWELEQQVTPILVKMRRRGVRVDVAHLQYVTDLAHQKEADYLAQVKHLTGVSIKVGDVMNARILAPAVKHTGAKIPITPKTKQPSIDNALLSKCGEVGEALLQARQWNKLRTTFCKQVREALTPQGRVHCTFNQLRANDDDGDGQGVRYGRLSSSNFNFQQQPIRHDDIGPLWRRVFVADEGAFWGCGDWSQQEPRIAVHYAEKLGLRGAAEFAERYRQNPSLDIHQTLADLSGMPRKIVKNYVNGSLYGMGQAKMCRNLGKPTEMKMRHGKLMEVPGPEGQKIIDAFYRFAPWIPGLTKKASDIAQKRAKNGEYGWVVTYLGRKLRFEKMHDGKILKAHKAFNRIGQGGAADQFKASLVEADRAGIPVNLPVHDEMNASFTSMRQAIEMKQIMLDTVRFNVPNKVDLETGQSWGELTLVR